MTLEFTSRFVHVLRYVYAGRGDLAGCATAGLSERGYVACVQPYESEEDLEVVACIAFIIPAVPHLTNMLSKVCCSSSASVSCCH